MKQYYNIIADEGAINDFVRILQDPEGDEVFFCTLFARKKYSNVEGAHDLTLARFTATKETLLREIKKRECRFGGYVYDNGVPVPQDDLAFYINPTPRSQRKAAFALIQELARKLADDNQKVKPISEAIRQVHKAKVRGRFVHFDIDKKLQEVEFDLLFGEVNNKAIFVVETRGGFHLLVDPSKIVDRYKKTFFKHLNSFDFVDVVGDQLVPMPGTFQGGFVPKLDYNI